MKKWIIPCLMTFGTIFLSVGCGKKDVQAPEEVLTAREKLSMQVFGNKTFQWNKNDIAYMASMRKLKNNLYGEEGRNLTCSIANGDSTYGWFSDTTIIEEPYVVAKNVTYETLAEECPDLLTTASDAKTI